MMKIFIILIIFFFNTNCSFDNKSGIWQNKDDAISNKNNQFKEFKPLSNINDSFNKEISIKKNFKFKIEKKITNYEWSDIYFDVSNNFPNLNYTGFNNVQLKSKRLSKFETNNHILYTDNKMIITDLRGNIIIYSPNEDKIINKFNFYKKKYKHIKKYLNISVDNDILIISDNIGYLYALSLNTGKIIWAQNYKIPFRSNLKIFKNKIIAANQNNNLYFINKEDGSVIRLIPTEEVIVSNQFINNISLTKNSTLFLNTYGTLYSVSSDSMKINWFINLNQTLDLNPSNLFSGSQIINNDRLIVVSTDKFTYVINNITGKIVFKKNFKSLIKPIITNDYLFSITNNNLLIALNLNNGQIIYSYNINQSIADYLNIKKKKVEFKSFYIVNDDLYILLKNSYFLIFNIFGELKKVIKLPSNIKSFPVFINNSIFYLNTKNKIFEIN